MSRTVNGSRAIRTESGAKKGMVQVKGRPLRFILGFIITGLAAAAAAAAAPEMTRPAGAPAEEFFETRVRPLLAARCFACHKGGTTMGGLDLSTRAGLLKGGSHGAVVIPGHPEKSPLVRAVRHQGDLKMPPGAPLPAAEQEILARWVAAGAAWGAAPAGRPEGASFWAFQRPRPAPLPRVRSSWWVRQPVDRFILAGLEQAGLEPSPYADRRTLIRRVTFDLTGLPPTPQETQAFVSDTSSQAWENLVDRLLSSPRYGERWGRHWLDVVRYSDSNGFDWNEIFPNAWRYRDYVIDAFNQDVPYDRFIKEQIAGDMLPARSESEKYRNLIATGVLVMGPKLLAQQDRRQLALDVIDEQIDLVSRGFLGLTVSCARCHDHKFDPIPTRDYYSLAGIFKSTVTLNGTLPRNDRVMYWNEMPLAPQESVQAHRAYETNLKKLQDEIKACKDETLKKQLQDRLNILKSTAPAAPPLAMAVRDGEATDLRVHVRGSYKNLGEPAPRGIVRVLGVPMPPAPAAQSGRRELAEWLASPENPLTARVMVNRVWQHYFGRGIVATSDNFGLLGERPSHPELLDWLAIRFMKNGWSLKRLHREILLSAAYRMSTQPDSTGLRIDPENRLFWRQNRQRLEAEAIRDAMLQITGELDLAQGGALVKRTTGLAGKEFAVSFDSPRRSVYLPVIRGGVYDMLQVFDFADPHVVNGRRDATTVPSQALFMMNSPFVRERAARLAARLHNEASGDEARIRRAYELLFCRPAETGEIDAALEYLRSYAKALDSETSGAGGGARQAWESLCHALIAGSEFRYRN